MDTFQHAYTAGIVSAAVHCSPEQIAVASVIAAAPDIVGFAEKVWKRDMSVWVWYNRAHSDEVQIVATGVVAFSILLGVFCSFSVLWMSAVILGFFGYLIHIALDSVTHEVGERWWKWKERLWAEVLGWGILGVVTVLVF